ncbi:hypothetical protein TSAR_005753 [Trichomalopsis sarcophagae]|uniref:Uncharacterized protein n=1 Tax=Trichomalopsis sarcophagae TaxID=543379 RepID=A0A232EK84_9HYME|nr:hypothetical protein TSAR_005753 [Trichomalopsis sarcophagae]
MNPQLKRIMPQAAMTRDERIYVKQQKIDACLAAIAKAETILLKDGRDLNDLPIIECLSDSTKLLADLQKDESYIRRIHKNVGCGGKGFATSNQNQPEFKKREQPAPSTEQSPEDVERVPIGEEQAVQQSDVPSLTDGETSGQRQEPPQAINNSVSLIAGRLQFFINEWRKITSDPRIISWLKGFKIPFVKKPVQLKSPIEKDWSNNEETEISKLLKELLAKGAICQNQMAQVDLF